MDYYTEIGKTPHYEEEHERDFPWSEVVETLLRTKRMRKKGDKLELE